jgi:predicted HTH domain antitoxin
MVTVTLEFPEQLCASLHRSPRELMEDIRLAAAIDWYNRGLISQGRAAELAGISRSQLLDALAERKIEAVQVTPDELQEEVALARSGNC